MSWIDVGRLNSGLTRIAGVKAYPKMKRQYVANRRRGRLFTVGVLHAKEMSESVLLRNRRGFLSAQVNTVAHAPSLYHWLYHRCGIPFAETRELAQRGQLRVDGVVVTRLSDLEAQLEWARFQEMDIQVRSFLPAVVHSTPSKGTGDEPPQGPWVPALKRALHRTYCFVYVHPGMSISSDEADPRSFVHRLSAMFVPSAAGRDGAATNAKASALQPATGAALGLNILRPIGFINGMRGLGIATNDVAVVRYWNNEFLGNYGVYDVRFPRGVPGEVVRRAAHDVETTLRRNVRRQLAPAVHVPCSSVLEPLPPKEGRLCTQLYGNRPLHDERLLVSTPLMPFRLVQRIRHVGGMFALTRSGPFALPASLPSQFARLLTPAELAVLFTFERRLKVNRMVLSLREFDEPVEEDETSSGDNSNASDGAGTAAVA